MMAGVANGSQPGSRTTCEVVEHDTVEQQDQKQREEAKQKREKHNQVERDPFKQQMQERQEKEKQKYEKEKQVSKQAEVEEVMNPDETFQLLLREKVIPNAAVCRFRDLGIELDLSGDDLDLIEQNVQQNPVIPIATKMLEDWLQLKGGALVEDLSTAIHNVDLITYAVTLAKEFGPNKKLTHRDLRKIIPNIATKWKDIGIELGIGNLDTYEKNHNPMEEKFKRMLQLWLSVNAKPIDELCDDFHKGLQGIGLNRAAKQFKENYEKFKTGSF